MISSMTEIHALEITTWTYPDEYSLYSFHRDKETMAELLDGTYFSLTDPSGALTGYFCFGSMARIPTDITGLYGEDALDIGLGMHPDLCGKGGGEAFLRAGLAFGRERFQPDRFRLTVAEFNRRAIRVYTRTGFVINRKILHKNTGKPFLVMEMDSRALT